MHNKLRSMEWTLTPLLGSDNAVVVVDLITVTDTLKSLVCIHRDTWSVFKPRLVNKDLRSVA